MLVWGSTAVDAIDVEGAASFDSLASESGGGSKVTGNPADVNVCVVEATEKALVFVVELAGLVNGFPRYFSQSFPMSDILF